MSENDDLLAEADDYEKNTYFLERDIEEDEFKIFYNAPESFLWKDHPENPFKVCDVIEWKKKAEKWDKLKPETKTILEIATEYSYDDVMAGRLSPEGIKTSLDEAFWEHGLQKGTWILELHELKNQLEAIKDMVSTDLSNYDKLSAIEDILEGEG